MSAHTPGPWHHNDFDLNVTELFDSTDSEVCALVFPNRYDNSRPETEVADAHLIAAAPELLEACELVKRYLRNLEDSTDPQDTGLRSIRARYHRPLHEAVDKAIAKAEAR